MKKLTVKIPFLHNLEQDKSEFFWHSEQVSDDFTPKNFAIDDCVKDGGEEFFTEMHCVL